MAESRSRYAHAETELGGRFGQIWVIHVSGRTTMANLPTNGPECSRAAGGTFRE